MIVSAARIAGMRALAGLTLALALTLSGCATADCDPATAGFFGGIGCEASGGFDARQAAKDQELAAARAQALAAKQDADQAATDQAAETRALADRRARLADLDASNARLRREVNAARARTDAQRRALDAARAQLAELEAHRRALPPGDDAALRALEDEERKKRQGIADILNAM
jgi:chromosome segregation ATPase